ncbi:MAG: MFS transporter, partial [Candidatus Acidiferrum sp.]
QNRVPDHLRGRMMAVYATMFLGIQPVGSLLAGGIAKKFGAPDTLAVFGMLCFVGSIFFIFLVAMRLKGQPEAPAAA